MEFCQNLHKEKHQRDKAPVQLPFILDWKWVLGQQLEFIEIGWCFLFVEDHRWEWTKSSCFIAFDPGGTLSLSKWLSTDSYTIYSLEAVNVVFDLGKLVSSLYGWVSTIMVGQSVLKAELLVLLHAWLVENLAAYKLEVGLLVFDPGGKIVATSEPMRATNSGRCSHGVYVCIQLLGMLLVSVSYIKVKWSQE